MIHLLVNVIKDWSWSTEETAGQLVCPGLTVTSSEKFILQLWHQESIFQVQP